LRVKRGEELYRGGKRVYKPGRELREPAKKRGIYKLIRELG